MDGLFLICLQN